MLFLTISKILLFHQMSGSFALFINTSTLLHKFKISPELRKFTSEITFELLEYGTIQYTSTNIWYV